MALDASRQLDETVRHTGLSQGGAAVTRSDALVLLPPPQAGAEEQPVPVTDSLEQLVPATTTLGTDASATVTMEQLVPIPASMEPEVRLVELHEQRVREEEEEQRVVEATRSETVNRVVNVIVALAALIALAPLFFIVALAIRFTSKGPIIYRQIRVGQDRRRQRMQSVRDRRRVDLGGRPFMIYKFRSMTVDAEKNGIVWAQKADSRVTPLGRVLRLTRIDELPQLFNVLLGDMNIVGPRPERPGIFLQLREHIAEYPLRQRAKPGITGLAQIEQDYDNSIADVRRKVQYDLTYIRQQSLAEDLRIMLNTLPVMLTKRGAR